jgi:hypothetical protein
MQVMRVYMQAHGGARQAGAGRQPRRTKSGSSEVALEADVALDEIPERGFLRWSQADGMIEGIVAIYLI